MAAQNVYDMAYRSIPTTKSHLINHMKLTSLDGLSEEEFTAEKDRLGGYRDEFLKHDL